MERPDDAAPDGDEIRQLGDLDDDSGPEDDGPQAFEDDGPQAFEDGLDEPSPNATMRRMKRPGQMIGAAMIGLAEVLQPRPKTEVPIEIATPGEPPNIDTKGLDETIGAAGGRMVGPPLDRIKSRQRVGRTEKRRR